MPIYHDPADARRAEHSAYGGIIDNADYDREIFFATIHGGGIDVFAFTDWLATMRLPGFWTFPQQRGADGLLHDVAPVIRYTVGQQRFITDIWREFSTDWKRNPVERPNLIQHLYKFGDLPVLMYSMRREATRTGYSHDSREQPVEFDSVMDMMVRFVAAQLPFLHVLHELDQACYESASADDVREVVRRGYRTNREPFERWVGEWTQFHIRTVLRQELMPQTSRHRYVDDDGDSGGPSLTLKQQGQRASTEAYEPPRPSPIPSTSFEP